MQAHGLVWALLVRGSMHLTQLNRLTKQEPGSLSSPGPFRLSMLTAVSGLQAWTAC